MSGEYNSYMKNMTAGIETESVKKKCTIKIKEISNQSVFSQPITVTVCIVIGSCDEI